MAVDETLANGLTGRIENPAGARELTISAVTFLWVFAVVPGRV
jgi:hypothetical protein